MKMEEAKRIMEEGLDQGYLVHLERKHGNILSSDYFPDVGEEPIKTEREAWELARKFAAKTVGQCVDIYVVRARTFRPVEGYRTHKINNRE